MDKEKEVEFCKWLARKVIELDNDGAIVELACRKLNAMGYLSKTDTEWTLPCNCYDCPRWDNGFCKEGDDDRVV